MNNPICFLNDRFIPLAEAGLPVTDLGVQRGYGIFDFLRITKNIPLFCDDHLHRFFHSAKEMRLPVQQTKEELKRIIGQLLEKNNLPESGIRIMLSGGVAPDGFQILEPNLVIVQQPITPPSAQILQQGYTLVTYPHQRQMPQLPQQGGQWPPAPLREQDDQGRKHAQRPRQPSPRPDQSRARPRPHDRGQSRGCHHGPDGDHQTQARRHGGAIPSWPSSRANLTYWVRLMPQQG